jgi:hypothetical protein
MDLCIDINLIRWMYRPLWTLNYFRHLYYFDDGIGIIRCVISNSKSITSISVPRASWFSKQTKRWVGRVGNCFCICKQPCCLLRAQIGKNYPRCNSHYPIMGRLVNLFIYLCIYLSIYMYNWIKAAVCFEHKLERITQDAIRITQ